VAVYTRVGRAALERFLEDYHVGGLVAFEGIRGGIENTNYAVDTTAGRYILTLFEVFGAAELERFLALMTWLAGRGFPGARPVPDRGGRTLRSLEGRPAALVVRLPGEGVKASAAAHCAAVGRVLATLHRIGADYPRTVPDIRGARWHLATARRLLPVLDRERAALLREELEHQRRVRRRGAPRGVVHADLFRDNVLFEGERVSGVIDLYYACTGPLVYDLAVAANDWCARTDGGLDPGRVRALLGAYAARRRLVPAEAGLWPAMLRAAALRFWLSRLHDAHFPRAGELTRTKDPEPLRTVLLHRRRHEGELRALWLDATG